MENKYNLSEEEKELLAEFINVFANHDETSFGYGDIDYGTDYKDGKILVYEDKENGREWLFDTPEDFFEHFMLDGKPFIERLNDLTDYD